MNIRAASSSPLVALRTLVVAVTIPFLVFVLVRALGGTLDSSFDTDGKVLTIFAPFSNGARAVAIQTDGKIVAAGESTGDFALARYNTDGSLDASFDGDGKVTTDIGVFDVAFAVAIQPDGKIVAAGETAPDGFCCRSALARYNPDGSLDTSFDGDGKVTTAGITTALAIALQPDGKIVAAGALGFFDSDFALARYNPDGSLDLTFDGDGMLTTDFGGFDSAQGIVVQGDGKIVAAGSGAGNDFVLARYHADGSLDTSFDGDGKAATDFGGFDQASGLALQADGKLVAAGRGGFLTVFALARYNADGTLDGSFDGDGKVTTQFFGENIEWAEAVAIQANGKIVAVGTVESTFNPSFGVARYNTDGSLDMDFGNGGKLTTDFGDPADVGVLCPPGRPDCSNDSAMDVAIQGDGKIVVVGGAGACTPPCSFAVARYSDEQTVLDVSIDIRPGSITNPVNPSARGVVPVAIISSAAFDAVAVAPSTVCFGDVDESTQRDCSEEHGIGHIEDVNRDGRPDLLLHFAVAQSGMDAGDSSACLTGQTFEGSHVHGCDGITTR